MASAGSLLASSSTPSRPSAPPAKVRKLEGALESLRNRMAKNREGTGRAAMAAVHTAESSAVAFLAGMTQGYLGDERTKLFGVDAISGAGVLGVGYGLYGAFNGHDGASHVLALGNGALAAGLAFQGARIGRKLALESTSASTKKPRTINAKGEIEYSGKGEASDSRGSVREVVLTRGARL